MHEKYAKKVFFGYQIVEKTFHIHELNINGIRSQSPHYAEMFLDSTATNYNVKGYSGGKNPSRVKLNERLKILYALFMMKAL